MATFLDIDQYLTDVVDIRHVTLVRGSRVVTTDLNVASKITQHDTIIRDISGNIRGTDRRTVVYLKPSQSISVEDEVILDSIARPVQRIEKIRDDVGIHHLEAYL